LTLKIKSLLYFNPEFLLSYNKFSSAGSFTQKGDEVIFLINFLLAFEEVELRGLGCQSPRSFGGRLGASMGV
jgi:hypothetical protein